MQTVLVVLLVAAVVIIVIVLARAHAERERQRKAALQEWARVQGFSFQEKDPWNLDRRFNGIGDIGRGQDRYAFEVLSRRDPAEAFIFRYHFKTTETRTVTRTDSKGRSYTTTETYQQDHWRRYLIVDTAAAFPSLQLRREGLLDKIAALVGFDDINFESEAFSRQYFCKSENRQFAYALIHPQMMQWLMERPLSIWMRGGLVLMDLSSTPHTAETCAAAWKQICGFVNQIPSFVWQDYGQREPIRFDELPLSRSPASPAVS